ncbi:MAG: glutaredoxin family protein [Gammaproteobacteria bacterium]|uniref:glutaredoxin domain-containing protein n=1 Tax=Rhodoferax sp. TaxID=50421 RepID=UPI00180D359D|nr:glutaredoxin domain-containing protein [Rhodoferax sp.]MBU3899529.1 glutaredoxin family protein [Gammaproteobacteria bacterium]MBA3059599.1 glutaredoxin family protein [Rhodoferax sp.]MBU4018005.1 glutaredoxin family protein [Gammaproteobacteria bacterium]MBU4080304.1 glutaredoxin family protein [Gammaproteobacteria bacterium]MBU4113027.1 glutaredoxin family protein [Gammaproteobacteria bacterium]
MKNGIHPIPSRTWGAPVLGAALLLTLSLAQAQTVYKIVGPDGKVTFSDKPPVTPSNVTPIEASAKSGGGNGPVLPYELRQVLSKYPVTLYTSSNCAPCRSAVTLLSTRGIPFTEKTVTTSEDAEALQRISGESSLPFLTIGGQQLKGFSDSEWTQYLDAAGYPKASVLPPQYRRPAATALVAIQKSTPAAKAQEEQTQAAPIQAPAAPANNAANPAGIKF